MPRGLCCQLTTEMLAHPHLLHHYLQQAICRPVQQGLDEHTEMWYMPNGKIFSHMED